MSLLTRIEDFDDPRLAEYRDIPDPELLRRHGLFIAEGRLVVRALLERRARRLDAGASVEQAARLPRVRLRSLLVTDTAMAAMEDVLGEHDDLPVYVCSLELLRHVSGFNFHRGCLAAGERPAPRSLDEVLTAAAGEGPVVVLEGVGNADNVGGIFRSASALGARAVLLGPGCCDPLYRKAIRVSTGTVFRLPYAEPDLWPEALDRIKERGYTVAAFTLRAEALALGSPRLTERLAQAGRRVALLLGSEGEGLSTGALDRADVQVRIRMEPDVDSLNVTTAAAIGLHALRVDPGGNLRG